MRCGWCAASLVLGWPTVALGQSVESAAGIQSYEMSTPDAVRLQGLRVLSVPIAVRLPIADWAAAHVRSGFADAEVTLPNGASAKVNGIIDATVMLEARRGPLAASVTAILPTGRVVENLEEAAVVGLLASELFHVAVQQWGTGGGVGLDVAYARRWGPTRLGLSAGALRLGGSQPFGQSSARYQPGMQLRGRAALESPVGDAGLLTVFVGLQRFSADGLGGENVYRAGMRMEGAASYAHALGSREGLLLGLGMYSLGAGDVDGLQLESASAFAAQFPGASQPISRRVFTGDLEVRVTRSRIAVTPRASLRFVRSPQGLSQGWMTSVGGGVEYRLLGRRHGRRLLVAPSFAVRVGRLLSDAQSSSGFRGWEATVGLRWAQP